MCKFRIGILFFVDVMLTAYAGNASSSEDTQPI